MTEATPDVEQLVSEYVDLLNGDYSKLDILSESYSYHGPGLPEEGIQGREPYRGFLQTFHDGFSDLEYAITDIVASDAVVMAEWMVTGTHDGEFNEIPPTGREIEMNTMGKCGSRTVKSRRSGDITTRTISWVNSE
ncbi:ester cyclase [Natrialbaceae archaeon A-CW3]